MKKTLLLMLAFSALLACADKTSALKQEFLPKLNGSWLLTDYIADLDSTHSPARSYRLLRDVVAMAANADAQSDTLIMQASWNNHEGWWFPIYFEAGQAAHSLKTGLTDYDDSTGYYELAYDFRGDERFLLLHHYNQQGLLDTKRFSRIETPSAEPNLEGVFRQLVNEKLFSGTWSVVLPQQEQPVNFTVEGAVSGLSAYRSYYVSTDFAIMPLDSPDVLTFDSGQEPACMVFRMQQDTLSLYHAIPEAEGYGMSEGALVYKLIRK